MFVLDLKSKFCLTKMEALPNANQVVEGAKDLLFGKLEDNLTKLFGHQV